MVLSAESQEEEMAYSHDDMMLSTVQIAMSVEEGSEESQLFTQNAPLDEDRCDEDGGSAGNSSDCEQAAERRSSDTNSDDDGNGGEEDYQEDNQYHIHDEEQASADEVTNQGELQYAQQEEGEGDTAGEEGEAHHLGEDDQQATDYVGQCHLQLEHLRKRKREQEEHVENLVEATFSQIDTLVNTLMRTMQECHAASHNRFEIADAKLAHNLHFHNRMEKKLRMIASILLEESADTQEEE